MSNEMPKIHPIAPYLTTKVITIDRDNINMSEMTEAAEIIQTGGLVAFPTETVYGLGADVFHPESINQIFRVKGRPNDNPLITHISDLKMLDRLAAFVSDDAKKLIAKFWPGALTIIFPRAKGVPDEVTAGLDTVGVRMPSHPIAYNLIRLANTPIAAPSANLSTKPSPTLGSHCVDDLNGRVEMIIDGGACDIGVESTVLMLSPKGPVILRPGGVTLEMLREVIPTTCVYKMSTNKTLEAKPPTPGMKYRHYAPSVETVVVVGNKRVEKLEELCQDYKQEGKRVGLVTWSMTNTENCEIVLKVDGDKYKGMAHALFMDMRDLDKKVDVIFIEGVDEIKEGLAVMNRAKKAAVRTIEAN
ncbi:sua5, putative [Entamoeba invadens IP1]|uniref:sua5, putative n=1 Tax=Entamoeba invadens IP1 TaxID=370355 RepID=UPI0002C3EE28|nr:sua5, putative [Entamoeba invadens IP1]ELP93151.1 sua5, putative [Entamoeba invadens IP1]|eukprot:XP_004259922.1 sua5, putative [Entamoeba invadens IP1]